MTVEDYLMEALMGYLKRKSVPVALEGDSKDEARAAEITALLRVVMHHAPASLDLAEAWWPPVETHLGRHAKTRGWPMESEIEAACIANRNVRLVVSNDRPRPVPEVASGSPDAIHAARRIKNREAVASEALWGVTAHEMLDGRMVELSDLNEYREAVYRDEAKVWDETVANERLREREKRHETNRPRRPDDDGRRFTAPTYHPKAIPETPRTPASHLVPQPLSDAPRAYTKAELAEVRKNHGLPPIEDTSAEAMGYDVADLDLVPEDAI